MLKKTVARRGVNIVIERYKFFSITLLKIETSPHEKIYKVIGITIFRKEVSLKEYGVDFFGENLHRISVPLVYKSEFYNFSHFPVNSKDFFIRSDRFDCPKIAVVMQGPILYENDFTYQSFCIYKKIFNNSNVKLILSTWRTENKNEIERFKKLGVDVVLSEFPSKQGRSNVNYQITSTIQGIKRAKDWGGEYILKTRSDQRFYAKNILEFLLGMMRLFPVKESVNLKARLIALSFNSFKYRMYGISDMFLFGRLDDVFQYWNIKLDNMDKSAFKGCTDIQNFLFNSPETYIATEFLRNIGWNVKMTFDDSLKVYADLFCFVDRNVVGLYWPKYSNLESRWISYKNNNIMEEIGFSEWINLCNRDSGNFGNVLSENDCEILC